MALNTRTIHFKAVYPNRIDPDQSENFVPQQLIGSNRLPRGLPEERRQAINRRDGVWWTFLYGNFHPRRRISRRLAEQHHFLFDWHEPRILYLALSVLLLSCTDALITLNLIQAGATEGNAVMAAMLDQSVDRFLAAKIGITSISLIILVAAARRKFYGFVSVENMLQAFCAGYVLLICYEAYMFWYVFELSLS